MIDHQRAAERSSDTEPADDEISSLRADAELVCADAELVKAVRNAGISSAEARRLGRKLQDIGVGTLVNLYSSGTLFKHVARRRVSVPLPPPQGFQRDECRSLIYLAVASTVSRFMENQIFGGGWSPNRGASLRTYFISGCLYAFADEYRRFVRAEAATLKADPWPTHDLDELVDFRTRPASATNPEDQALDRAEVEAVVRDVAWSTEDRVLIFRLAQGFTYREIAAELGVSEASLNRRLRRIRQKAKDRPGTRRSPPAAGRSR